MYKSLYALFIIAFLTFFGCQPQTEPQQDSDPFAGFNQGWNRIEPGGETICSTGTPYAYYFKPGDPRKILVYFDGGGACWSFENCNPQLKTLTHSPFVIDSIDNPGLHNEGITGASWQGIFDLDNSKNPVADYTMLMLPYCTADTHLGNAVADYQDTDSDSTIMINHKGYVNASTALAWLDSLIEQPEEIIVTGVSAGSIASPVYAALLSDRYREATVIQIGDASGGYKSDRVSDLFKLWGADALIAAAFPDRDTTMLPTHENFYLWAARGNKNLSLSQYNAANDGVQAFFLSQLGVKDIPVAQTILENHKYIAESLPEFQYYIDSGSHHGIIIRDGFYTTQSGNISLFEWFGDLIDGKQPKNVVCEACYD